MTDWVRLWHDMPTDPKWRTIARKSGQPLSCVISLFTLLMVNASANAEERGTLRNWDGEDAAAALDIEPEAVAAIMDAMQGKVIEGDRLTGWERRQPKREDTSGDRVRAFRERKRTQGNALEHSETPVKRNVTQCNAPETETDTDTDNTPPTPPPGGESVKPAKKSRTKGPLVYSAEFEAWWSAYPRKEAKGAAQEAYERAKERIGKGATEKLITAAVAYRKKVAGTEERFIAHPTTWLNQARWDDESGPMRSGLMPHQIGRDRLGVGG